MTKKKEKRGRKALPPGQKKPPQPTIKINDALFPFVKLLKAEYKAKRINAEKINALTQLLLDGNTDLTDKKQTISEAEAVIEEKSAS
ncbi:MAG: hypothetical protein Q7U57_17245 [Methylovulum sp.]|nr:hypothetical protein [Methylovulum sp.]